MTKLLPLFFLMMLISFSGCQKSDTNTAGVDSTSAKLKREALTEEQQQNLSTDQIVSQFQKGNERFLKKLSIHPYYLELVQQTAKGQFPKAVILSCIDSRAPVEAIFDKNIGDLFTTRVAGNYADSGVIGGIEFATMISGAKVIIVMGHTDCGAVKGACDNVELGNLTYVVDQIRPAVDSVKGFENERNSKNKKFVEEVSRKNVVLTMEKLRSQSSIITDLEKQGKVKIVGAMYHLEDGKVDFLNY
ncbi:MAG: carbonic anhydrase family protein [bacterium]